jgi:DNA-binding NtrC family response regulator
MDPQSRSGVLVVDNDAEVRETLEKRLRQHGFAVWLASDTHEASELIQHHCQEIDFMWLDVCVPGWESPQMVIPIRRRVLPMQSDRVLQGVVRNYLRGRSSKAEQYCRQQTPTAKTIDAMP